MQGDKVLMGGLMRGDIDVMWGGPNFERLYHKLKVLLLLLPLCYVIDPTLVTQLLLL